MENLKCLQCNKPANDAGAYGEYSVRECADGHRTVALTKKQERAIKKTLDAQIDNGESIADKIQKAFAVLDEKSDEKAA